MRGFTLIEMLIVMVVISLMTALILPVVSSVRNTAKEAATITEIKNFEAAIANFKLNYGAEIPDEFVLYENADGWNNTDMLTKKSKIFIRSVWPYFDFLYHGDKPGTLASWQRDSNGKAGPPDNNIPGNKSRDFNGNGTEDDVIHLVGIESLLFFIGGVNITEDDTGDLANASGSMDLNVQRRISIPTKCSPYGFSTNPEMPFVRGGSRTKYIEVNDRMYGFPVKIKSPLDEDYCFYSSWGRGYSGSQDIPFIPKKNLQTYQILTKNNNKILSN